MSDGMAPEAGVPGLADIMQQILGILQDHEQRISTVCQAHEDLDKEIHEDFFGPIHEQYQASVRGKGIEDLKGRYGSMFDDDMVGALKGFGIDDVFGRLYDELEKLKGSEGWSPESEKSFIDGIHNQAMERIAMIRGKPKEPEKPSDGSPPAAAVVVAGKKEEPAPASPGAGLRAGKKRASMLDGY